MRAIRLLVAAVVVLAGVSAGQSSANELKVLSAIAVRPALQELAPAFETASKHKLKIEYATAGAVAQKIEADDELDVVILTQPLVAKLVKQAKIVGGTTKVLARAEIGLAVKKGAKKPDISSPEALKQALLNAKSLAYGDPASGGAVSAHIGKVVEKLGIADALKPKTRLMPAATGPGVPPIGQALQRGDVEIGMGSVGTLSQIEGIEVVGPLPADLQSPELVFVAGSPQGSEQPVPAKAFIDFLAGPKAKEVYKAKGLQPG